MHEQGLELSLHIVTNAHGQSNFLVESILGRLPVDLLLKRYKQQRYQDGPEVLNKEHHSPRNLQTKIFEHQHCISLELSCSEELAQFGSFVSECTAFCVANSEAETIDVEGVSLNKGESNYVYIPSLSAFLTIMAISCSIVELSLRTEGYSSILHICLPFRSSTVNFN